MSIIGKLRHWFIPHTTNNFRSRLLHNSGIFAVIVIILTGNVFLRLLDSTNLHILGFTSTITIDEVVHATNNERIGAGLKPLSYNEKLADAARRKAENMFSENYWAHNSPSGKSPWVWFKDVGYTYVFAGENLAKDFGDTSRMMSAWMASPTHKENIINPKYTEIGIAVVPGTLQGQETVLVVQLFGAPNGGAVSDVGVMHASPAPIQIAEVKGQKVEVLPTSSPIAVTPPRYNKFNVARSLNLGTTALFILALILDFYLAELQKLTRRVGDNWAHILFINLILLATVIVNAGKIL
ncbi:hypothetical protein COT87_00425 [Candidatus Collierbacteria bacterium CG10_big_fil_rev_8_21_14_0_10_44_9]|uniref:SCP domain-containing protein n=1 Tax=Candidatus Collierbacteria bacterium CG10_big_fil_rev_8_21_14_0_10_44_9 TaxID=1974535 RepID=A0A2H0VJH8_9BACT|nr:MAG: hypothetical protein COT87_00425 [Candidatus Collierbacteria bacterium CG10_big_fil_rev_8_21_14_0_10_44_9]